MAMLSQPRLILFLVFTSGILLAMVKGDGDGDVCGDDTGECGTDCSSRCASKHSGGKGTCEAPNICRCYYDCERKACKISLGYGATGCDDKECNSQCNAKFPTPEEEAHGYCYSIAALVSCFCQYRC